MGSVEEICDHIALINQSKKILGGPVKQVREDFKNNTYEIEFIGNLMAFTNALWTGFEFLDKEQLDNNHFLVQVRGLKKNNINALLNAVLPYVELRGVQEKIPSMNEVFIQAVEAQNGKEANHG